MKFTRQRHPELFELFDSLNEFNSRTQMWEFLESNGFERVGSGSESVVFTRDDLNFVIKICHVIFGGLNPMERFDEVRGNGNYAQGFALPFHHVERGWFIAQQRVNALSFDNIPITEYERFRELTKKGRVFPRPHDDWNASVRNMGEIGGRYMIIDWIAR